MSTPKHDPLDTLTVDHVLTICHISRTTLYQWITAGRFPEPTKLGWGRTSRVVWRRGEIQEWLQHRSSGLRRQPPKRVQI
jgi:predicted DNA-binding transcriptional regulator AlpA